MNLRYACLLSFALLAACATTEGPAPKVGAAPAAPPAAAGTASFRTTDFACEVSPAMHADIKSLVEGGYSAQEILDAFVDVDGERALMAPRAEGFNLVGYIAPFVAFGAGAVGVVALLRSWNAKKAPPVAAAPVLSATPDELARLDAAIRDDS